MSPRVPSAPSAYPRADQRVGDGVGPNRLGGTDRLCETLSSWRLLVGGPSPAASHHSFTTSSEEPPLSNFNSYHDIPLNRRTNNARALRLKDDIKTARERSIMVANQVSDWVGTLGERPR